METYLYVLHPVFEFYITAYFAFIIAPEFVSNFIIFKIPKYVMRSKEKILSEISFEIKRTNKYLKKISNSEFEIKDKTNFVVYINNFNESIEKLIKLKDTFEIINEKDEKKIKEIKNNLVEEVNFRFSWIFPLMIIFNFLILLSNGCRWCTKNENTFLLYISYFDFLCFCGIILICFRKEILMHLFHWFKHDFIQIKIAEKMKLSHFVGLSLGMFFPPFVFFPIWGSPWDYFVFVTPQYTVMFTVIVGMLPILGYFLTLKIYIEHCLKYSHKKELDEIYNPLWANQVDFMAAYKNFFSRIKEED